MWVGNQETLKSLLCIWIVLGAVKEDNGLERKKYVFEGLDEGRKLKRG